MLALKTSEALDALIVEDLKSHLEHLTSLEMLCSANDTDSLKYYRKLIKSIKIVINFYSKPPK
jgi:hypothetical protein